MPIIMTTADLYPAWHRYIHRFQVPGTEQMSLREWVIFCKERAFADHRITLHISGVDEPGASPALDGIEFESEAAVTAFMLAHL